MICNNCGNEINPNQRFCSRCGQAVNTEVAVINNSQNKKKTTNIIIIIVVCVLVFSALTAGVITLIVKSNQISAKNYINDEIEITGYNGYGYAYVSGVFDYESLSLDMGPSSAYLYDEDPIYDYIYVELDTSENLSNGDTVTATITVDYDYINYYKYDKKLVGKEQYTKQYEVKGLDEPTTIDPFEAVINVLNDNFHHDFPYNIDTTFSKTYGDYTLCYDDYDGEMKILYSDGSELSNTDFYPDDDESLEIVDGKATISVGWESDDFIDYGIVIAPTEKEFTVVDCDLLTKADDLPVEDYNTLKEKANSMLSEEEYDNYEFEGSYFGYRQPYEDSWSDDYGSNCFYLIYSYEYEGETYRCIVEFYAIRITSEGDIVKSDLTYDYSEGFYYENIEEFESDTTGTWDTFSKVTISE